MDLGQLKVSFDSVEFRLIHPVTQIELDGPTDPIFWMLSPQHDKVQAVKKKLTDSVYRRKKKDVEPEVIEKTVLDILIACIDNWQNIELDGEPLEFSKQNAEKLLSDPAFGWVRNQIQEFVDTESNFFKKH